MILFINVFITDNKHPLYNPYNLGLYTSPNPYEIFKYSLASLSVIPWGRVIIYCELDDNYSHNAEDLKGLTATLFKNCSLHLWRNRYQREWKKSLAEVMEQDGLVWYTGNHDHIFIDYDLDVLTSVTEGMLASEQKMTSCYFSHWAEALDRVGGGEQHPAYATVWQNDSDSIQILSKEALYDLWWTPDYGDKFVARTDHSGYRPRLLMFVPMRELCRHFDGYDRPGDMHQDINRCPPLFIPDGFWERKMKISYGKKLPGHIYVDPCNPNYRCVAEDGADLRCTLEDLPLFWRDRIEVIEAADDMDERRLLECRNDNVWYLSCANKPAAERDFPTREHLKICMR